MFFSLDRAQWHTIRLDPKPVDSSSLQSTILHAFCPFVPSPLGSLVSFNLADHWMDFRQWLGLSDANMPRLTERRWNQQCKICLVLFYCHFPLSAQARANNIVMFKGEL